jgi:hypothetical protein
MALKIGDSVRASGNLLGGFWGGSRVSGGTKGVVTGVDAGAFHSKVDVNFERGTSGGGQTLTGIPSGLVETRPSFFQSHPGSGPSSVFSGGGSTSTGWFSGSATSAVDDLADNPVLLWAFGFIAIACAIAGLAFCVYRGFAILGSVVWPYAWTGNLPGEFFAGMAVSLGLPAAIWAWRDFVLPGNDASWRVPIFAVVAWIAWYWVASAELVIRSVRTFPHWVIAGPWVSWTSVGWLVAVVVATVLLRWRAGGWPLPAMLFYLPAGAGLLWLAEELWRSQVVPALFTRSMHGFWFLLVAVFVLWAIRLVGSGARAVVAERSSAGEVRLTGALAAAYSLAIFAIVMSWAHSNTEVARYVQTLGPCPSTIVWIGLCWTVGSIPLARLLAFGVEKATSSRSVGLLVGWVVFAADLYVIWTLIYAASYRSGFWASW